MTLRAKPWFPNEQAIWVGALRPSLLLRDFNTLVVPYGHNREKYKIATTGVKAVQIKNLLHLWGNGKGPESFIRDVSSSLLTDYEVWLEVGFEPQKKGSAPFEVQQVWGVKKRKDNTLLQEIPSVAEQPQNGQRGTNTDTTQIELNPETMIQVTLPREYPASQLKSIRDNLVEIDVAFKAPPDWTRQQITGEKTGYPTYNFSEANSIEKLRIAEVTQPIGWISADVAGTNTDLFSEYYLLWRRLRFLHFRASLRRCAEKALRKVLSIAENKCNFEVNVTCQGLYSPNEVEEIIREYEYGRVSLPQATEIVFEASRERESKERTVF